VKYRLWKEGKAPLASLPPVSLWLLEVKDQGYFKKDRNLLELLKNF
jgi:hypothetical protein